MRKVTRPKKKGPTDRYLQILWRTCVLLRADHRCSMCGHKFPADELQAHHYARRSIRLTRHDPLNGAALCIPCHEKAGKPWHGAELMEKLERVHVEYLDRVSGMLYKDWLAQNAFTDGEWRNIEKTTLQDAIAYLSTPAVDRLGMKIPARLRLDALA